MNSLISEVIRMAISAAIVIGFVGINALFLVWLERKVSARIQLRHGPLYVGWQGTFQTLADAVKLLGKELILPKQADKFLFIAAPLIVFTPALALFLVLPVGPGWIIQDLNIGILLVFALANISFIGIFIAGWSSNNKYGVLGSMRAVAQNISYEIPLLLSVMGVILLAGTFKMTELISFQQQQGWFIWKQPLAFLIFFCSALAEANRAPFDIPEAESELVAGFHTEYSGMRFAMFFLGEYTAIFVSSAIATTLFWGGWLGPAFLPPAAWFFVKTYAIILAVIWVRWTFPRLRSDQLMAFCWKILIPAALVNLLVTVFLATWRN
ncbi:MAG: NADH-quinone oxidoreductase subunit NuoH [Candidatus Omnitrophica bacterium]|nr:NADH-quinone oxidoreductase subunit NuoH [Candidatus Omnitrophota bacterium]